MPSLTDMLQASGLPVPPGLPAGFAGITADSRAVRPGMLFAALPGSRSDGRAFIPAAVAAGAAAVLAPLGTAWPEGVPPRPMIHAAEPRQALARLAAAAAGPLPATLVAVTGTNGKTSTADFLRQLLGPTAAAIGTVGITPPLPPEPGEPPILTSPDPVTLAAVLSRLAARGTTAAVLEASSHGLDQFRLDGLRFSAAAFTNLTRDHLDYHGTLDAYRAAKLRLFTELLPEGAPAVASTALDDASMAALRAVAARRRLRLHTVGDAGDLFRLARAVPHPAGQTLHLHTPDGPRTVELPLPGRFQAENALVAAALAAALGVADPLALLPRLHGVRGRLEHVATHNGAAVYVDYAHTPDALDRLLASLRPHTPGRLHLVFGAGGDRDPGKRPLMGAAARAADAAVVTDDNPRGEPPAAIRAAILAAIPAAREIGDRRDAIAAALAALAPGDVLVVAGKGHEAGQTVAGVTHPFDDADTVRQLVGGPA